MKTFLIGLIFAISNFSYASTIVHGSIYMALGPASKNYFSNINAVNVSIESSGYYELTPLDLSPTKFELSQLLFTSAEVDGDEVTYNYFNSEEGSNRETCILNVILRMKSQLLVSVKSSATCSAWDD